MPAARRQSRRGPDMTLGRTARAAQRSSGARWLGTGDQGPVGATALPASPHASRPPVTRTPLDTSGQVAALGGREPPAPHAHPRARVPSLRPRPAPFSDNLSLPAPPGLRVPRRPPPRLPGRPQALAGRGRHPPSRTARPRQPEDAPSHRGLLPPPLALRGGGRAPGHPPTHRPTKAGSLKAALAGPPPAPHIPASSCLQARVVPGSPGKLQPAAEARAKTRHGWEGADVTGKQALASRRGDLCPLHAGARAAGTAGGGADGEGPRQARARGRGPRPAAARPPRGFPGCRGGRDGQGSCERGWGGGAHS